MSANLPTMSSGGIAVAVQLSLTVVVEEWAEGAVQQMRVLMLGVVMAMAEMAANRIGLVGLG